MPKKKKKKNANQATISRLEKRHADSVKARKEKAVFGRGREVLIQAEVMEADPDEMKLSSELTAGLDFYLGVTEKWTKEQIEKEERYITRCANARKEIAKAS